MFNLRSALSSFCVDVNTRTHTNARAHVSSSSLNEIYRVCFAHALCAVLLLLLLISLYAVSSFGAFFIYFVFFFISLIALSFIRSNFYSYYYLICALALACLFSQPASQSVSSCTMYMYLMVYGNMFRPTIVRDVTSHSSSSCFVVVAVAGRCLCTRSFNTANRISSTDFFPFDCEDFENNGINDRSPTISIDVFCLGFNLICFMTLTHNQQ